MDDFKHNTLFGPPSDRALNNFNATVGKNGGEKSLADFSRGYFEAAKNLSKDILLEEERNDENKLYQTSARCHMDILVYPIALCLRHAMELGIKHFLLKTAHEPLGKKKKGHHRLNEMWPDAKKVLKEFAWTNEEDLENVDKVVGWLIEFDPDGQTFRYNLDTSGMNRLENTAVINIVNLGCFSHVMFEIFDGWFYAIDEP